MVDISEQRKQILSNLWVVDGKTLKSWGEFYPFEVIRDQLVRLPIEKALSKLGRIYRSKGDFNKAVKYYQRSLNLSEQLLNKRSTAIALDQFGSLFRDAGNLPKAIEYYQKSLETHLELGNDKDIGVEYGNLGTVYLIKEEFQKAQELFSQAIEYSSRAKDAYNLSIWHFNLGQILEQQGDLHKAKLVYGQALLLNRLVGNRNLERILLEKIEFLNRS